MASGSARPAGRISQNILQRAADHLRQAMLGGGEHSALHTHTHMPHRHHHQQQRYDASLRHRVLLGPALQIMRLAWGSETTTPLLLRALQELSWRNSCAPLSASALPMAGSYPFLAAATALLAADEQLRGSWAGQPAPALQQQLEELLSRKLPSMEDLTELMPQVGCSRRLACWQ